MLTERMFARPLRLTRALAAAALCAGCSSASSPSSDCPPDAEKWTRRSQHELETADIEEARDSVQKALAICPAPETRVLAARIALARLDYAETIRLVKDVRTSEAAGLRGRAYWYKGDLDAAADELEAMLNDPDIHDDWAKSIAKLARRGAGRVPFAISGALLTAVEMAHVSPVAPYFVVPVEIDGESALAMVSTGTAEVVLDSTTRKEPSWVSLRFGDRIEVQDVPALAQDLSGISKQMGAPIKALLGVNFLRHVNATMDYAGRQFVVRSFSPPSPPRATRIDLSYIRGGGMVLMSSFGGADSRAAMLVDTSMSFPVALDAAGWKKAGFDTATLKLVPEDPQQKLREGVLPSLHLGAYDVPRVPAYFGAPLGEMETALGLNIDGVIGAGLLAHFRVTLGDGGRTMWLEDYLNAENPGGIAPPEPVEPPAAAPPAAAPPAGPAPARPEPPNAPGPAGK